MKTLLLVLCLAFPILGMAKGITPLTQPETCVVETVPGTLGTCQILKDGNGVIWLVFWDDTRQVLFIRTVIDGEHVYLYKRKLGIPV